MTRSRDVADTQDNTGGAVAPFVAGKNKIINGDFGIWQRGTSFTANNVYAADRWLPIWDGSGATKTISQQAFTPGAAPVAGYESQYFLRFAQSVAGTGGTYNVVNQRIEDVRTFAGQSVTFSFWAKASSSISMASPPSLNQNFGSGGSATTYPGFTGTAPALTTSWQRFSFTTTVPSISGKTVGTSSYLEIGFNLPLNTTFTIDIWGVQLEAGNVATPFTTASGSIGGELALCQRYYFRSTPGTNYGAHGAYGSARTTTVVKAPIPFPVQMRVIPTSIDYSTLAVNDGQTIIAITGVAFSAYESQVVAYPEFTIGSASLTQYRPYHINNNNNSAAYLGFSAEL